MNWKTSRSAIAHRNRGGHSVQDLPARAHHEPKGKTLKSG